MSDLIVWCFCAWLGVGTPRHGRSAFCHEGVWAGPPAHLPVDPFCDVSCMPCGRDHARDDPTCLVPIPLVVRPAPGPEPERDARVPECEHLGCHLVADQDGLNVCRQVVRPAPDPARDARVAARRAEDARRAGRALDRFIGDLCDGVRGAIGESGRLLQRQYGTPVPVCQRIEFCTRDCVTVCGRIECQVGDGE